MGRLFGTDGIRGIANVDLRPTTAYALGRATAHELVGAGGSLVVGRDTRRSGQMFVAAIAAGAASLGADVHDAGVLPTPALAFLAGTGAFAAGIMVSASHNPADDNGLKVLDGRGLKLDDGVEDRLEQLIWRTEELGGPRNGGIGRLHAGPSLVDAYRGDRLRLAHATPCDLRIVLDCANGSGGVTAPEILAATGARVEVIHNDPDGENINVRCGATAPADLAEQVVARGADLGFALDGDADRLVAVDRAGSSRGRGPAAGVVRARSPRARRAQRRDPGRHGALERRPRGGPPGGRRAGRPHPGRGQVHPRRDAGDGREPRRREERPRHRARSRHDRRRAGDGARGPRHRRADAAARSTSWRPRSRCSRSSSGRSTSATRSNGRPTRSSCARSRPRRLASRSAAGSSSGRPARSPPCGSWWRARTRSLSARSPTSSRHLRATA